MQRREPKEENPLLALPTGEKKVEARRIGRKIAKDEGAREIGENLIQMRRGPG
jgi:hypothetical protein